MNTLKKNPQRTLHPLKKMRGSTFISFVLVTALFSSSCNKQNQATTTDAATASAVKSLQALAVSASTTPGDSVYIIHTCERGMQQDSVAFKNLPATVTDYLNANYNGYTFQKAYAIQNNAGATTAYVVIIQYNSKPVGVAFDASGNFVRVLEQREGHDLDGHGWHHGGMFDDRDGLRRDTVATSALPAAIISYFKTNYAQDTLSRAYKNADGSYLVISTNNGVFVTVFNANGSFVKRVQLTPREKVSVKIAALAGLPAAAQSYLTSTYPGYVFKQAYSISLNGTAQGYVVVIDANNTKYAVSFDAAGNFLKAITVR